MGQVGNRRTNCLTRLPSFLMGTAATPEHHSTSTDDRDSHPPECHLCARTLLVGEVVHRFADREEQARLVCDLCRSAAVRHEWMYIEQSGSRKRVRPVYSGVGSASDPQTRSPQSSEPLAPTVPAVRNVALSAASNDIIQYLRGQLGPAGEDPRLHDLPAEILGSIADKLGRQDRELKRLRREADPVRREHEQRTLAEQAEEIQELRTSLRARERRVQQLESARRAEIDPVAVCRHAIDAFNMSEHADRMARIARTLGDPDVWVHDQGMALPRIVHVTLAWDIAWYCFRVKLDLGVGRASVHELSTGGDPTSLDLDRARRNASWRESGLVLANADAARAVAPA